MMEAWLSRSEKTASSRSTSAGTTPALACQPEEKRSAASVPLKAARRRSRAPCAGRSPATRRAAPAPAPPARAAATAPATTRGWAASPR